VIDPLFQDNTYITDYAAGKRDYCFPNDTMFNGFTAIDRQTELSDDDGSLTGLGKESVKDNDSRETISVNEDSFFNAPTETPECLSNIGKITFRHMPTSRASLGYPRSQQRPALMIT
jgi:hypothetical protein